MQFIRSFRLPSHRAGMRSKASHLTLAVLSLLLCGQMVTAQDRLLFSLQRPVADLVYTLGGKLGHSPSVNNAALISAALADRTKSVVTLPAGIIEITQPIVWPGRTGITLLGAGPAGENGDAAYSNGHGGTTTRIVANFSDANSEMLTYKGVLGRIEGITLEGYKRPGAWHNFITNATDATPIVCTANSVHGLSDGDRITIYGVPAGGNESANGTFYVKASGYSTRRFALYRDASLTTSVAGSGNGDYSGRNTVVWRPYNRARIGIHVLAKVPNGINTGKIDVRNCSFVDLPVGILFGKNMDRAYEQSATFDGDRDNHADQSVIDHCAFFYPYTLDYPSSEHRTCMLFRTIQALGFTITHATMNGACDEVLYFERGGIERATVFVNGKAQKGVLRTGYTQQNVSHELWCNLDAGTSGQLSMILNMDRHAPGGHIVISGNQMSANNDVNHPLVRPQFVIRGACKVNLEHFNGIVPNSIQLVGQRFRNAGVWFSRLAQLRMNDCTFWNTSDPATAVIPTNDATNPSVEPYYWKRVDCQAGERNPNGEQLEIQPLTDGDDTSHLGHVTFGP